MEINIYRYLFIVVGLLNGCGTYSYFHPYEARAIDVPTDKNIQISDWSKVAVFMNSKPKDKTYSVLGKIYLAPPCYSTNTGFKVRLRSIMKEASKFGANGVLFSGNRLKIESPLKVVGDEFRQADTLIAIFINS